MRRVHPCQEDQAGREVQAVPEGQADQGVREAQPLASVSELASLLALPSVLLWVLPLELPSVLTLVSESVLASGVASGNAACGACGAHGHERACRGDATNACA